MSPADIKALVDAQAEDQGLWFLTPTAPEAYLQKALRTLHAALETPEYQYDSWQRRYWEAHMRAQKLASNVARLRQTIKKLEER